MSRQEAAPLRGVRKANARTKAVLHSRALGVGPGVQSQRLQPECATVGGNATRSDVALGFTLACVLVEQVRRLAIVGPGQAEVQRQVLADLPVVATIKEGVVFAEVQVRSAGRDLHAVRGVGSKERVQAGEPELS